MKTSPLELLAMLTPHGPDMLARGRGGIPTLTPLDVAAAMGMAHLTRVEALLLQVKYALEMSQVRPLALAWYDRVVDIANGQGWQTQASSSPLLRLSLWVLRPCILTTRCAHCGGAGVHHNQKTCASCNGTGIPQPPSPAQAAYWLCTTLCEYSHVWSTRERFLSAELSRAEDTAENAIRRALKSAEQPRLWHGS